MINNTIRNLIRRLPFLSLPKINLKIKLVAFLLVSFLKIQANPSSDQDLLTLHLENVSVEKVFAQIEAISEYRFLFEGTQIPVERTKVPRFQLKEQ